MNKVLKVIINIALSFIIVIAAIVTIISLSSKEKGVANIAGVIPFSIQTNSMEPTIMTGDLVFTKVYTDQELKVDDIISFFAIEQQKKIVKTHRIIEVKDNEGMISYVTKGDNNDIADAVEVAEGDIISVFTGTRMTKVGYVLDFFKSKYGFLLTIILPLFAFFLYQLYSFIKLVMISKKENKTQESN